MPTLTRAKRGSSRFSKFPEARNIRNQAYKLVKNVLYNRSKFTNYRENRNENYLLMNNNNKTVLGFAFIGPNKKGMKQVTLLGTKPGHGYGRRIMDAIYINARNNGKLGVYINTAVNEARPFYRRLGYTEVPPHFSNMWKHVPTASLKRKMSLAPRKSVSPTSKRRESPNRRN